MRRVGGLRRPVQRLIHQLDPVVQELILRRQRAQSLRRLQRLVDQRELIERELERGYGAWSFLVSLNRFHGHTPSISTASEKLSRIRIRTMIPSTVTLSNV